MMVTASLRPTLALLFLSSLVGCSGKTVGADAPASSSSSGGGAPASAAGNAVSLAAELGAQNVSTTGVHLEDDQALRMEASRLAFLDAERQAETLAAASGRRVVRILRVQDSNARMPEYEAGQVQDIVVTGSRVRPTVAIPVDQSPVRVEVRLNVAFEIE